MLSSGLSEAMLTSVVTPSAEGALRWCGAAAGQLGRDSDLHKTSVHLAHDRSLTLDHVPPSIISLR
jgi:hypothetical protein